MSIPQWVAVAFSRHKARFGPQSFPDAEADLDVVLGDWADELARVAATPAEVERASAELYRLPKGHAAKPEWRPDHLAAIVARVQSNRGAARAVVGPSPGPDVDDLAEARERWRALPERQREIRLADLRRRLPGLAASPHLLRLAAVAELGGIDPLTLFPAADKPLARRGYERRRPRVFAGDLGLGVVVPNDTLGPDGQLVPGKVPPPPGSAPEPGGAP